jgi:hypothetical protein
MSYFSSSENAVESRTDAEEVYASEEQIKDIALRLALGGSKLDAERQRIWDYYQNKEKLVDLKYEDELARLADILSQIRIDLKENSKQKSIFQGRKFKLEDDQKRLDLDIVLQREINSQAWRQILKDRHTHGTKFFEDQTTRIAQFYDDDWKEIEKGVDHQIKIEQKLYEIQKQNYELNKEEFLRKAEKCKEEQQKVEKELERSNQQIRRLKAIGISKYSANFLLVAGFISLAGAGTIVANLLSDRQPEEDLLTSLVRNIGINFEKILPREYVAWAYILNPIGFVAIIALFLLFFYFLIRISDRLVARFDSTWDKDSSAEMDPGKSEKKQKRIKGNRPADSDKIEDVVNDYQSLKSYLDFLPTNLKRKDYASLIAAFPYIFLISTVVFLLAGHIDSKSHVSLSSAYVGVIVVLLTTSCWIIYVTRSIEPRWLKYGRGFGISHKDGDESPETVVENAEYVANTPNVEEGPATEKTRFRILSSYFWINREIVLLIVLMVFALILAAILPAAEIPRSASTNWMDYFYKDNFKHLVWGSLAIFVNLASLGLAYGVVQRGLFLNLDTLEYRRIFLINLGERLSSQPVIGGQRHFQLSYPANSINDYMDLRHSVERQRTVFETSEIFGDDYEITPAIESSGWLKVFRRLRKRNKKNLNRYLRRKGQLVRELRPMDFAVSPEAAQRFVESISRISVGAENIRLNSIELTSLDREIDGSHLARVTLESGRSETTTKRTEVVGDKNREIVSLRNLCQRELVIFTAAFAVGSIARPLLIEEGVPLIGSRDNDSTFGDEAPKTGFDGPRSDGSRGNKPGKKNRNRTEVAGKESAGGRNLT